MTTGAARTRSAAEDPAAAEREARRRGARGAPPRARGEGGEEAAEPRAGRRRAAGAAPRGRRPLAAERTRRQFWGEEPAAATPEPEPPEPPAATAAAAPTGPDARARSPWAPDPGAIRRRSRRSGSRSSPTPTLTRDEPPPPEPVRTITATIPEGYSRSQTAQLARELKLRGDYEKATIHSPYLDPAEYGGKDAENLEGFLFPDTFELDAHAPVGDLVRDQLQDFKRRIAGVDMSYAKSKNLTVYDVVTIASMVEEEAQLDSERKLIAAVIYNRLRDGIPLGIDATIRFANDNYTEPLTESELATDSPYNTRVNAGLPPGPISTPASPRSKPRPTRRRSTTSTTSSSRGPAASTPSPRPTPNSKPTSPATTKPAKRPAASRRTAAGDRPMPRLAVLGHPVGALALAGDARAALAELGLAGDWTYEAIDVAPDEFEAQVRTMAEQGFAGANVTVPTRARR